MTLFSVIKAQSVLHTHTVFVCPSSSSPGSLRAPVQHLCAFAVGISQSTLVPSSFFFLLLLGIALSVFFTVERREIVKMF